MVHIETGDLNNDFRTCLHRLMESGLEAHPRGTTTREHLNYNISLFNPRNRIINFPDRKTNLKYLVGELIWYFGGDNYPDGILPYSKFWANITNSGNEVGYEPGTINSNYGNRLFGHCDLPAFQRRTDNYDGVQQLFQWNDTIELLTKDKDSRQAILNIHIPSDRHEGNKDVACTLTLQFFIRENALHMIVNMRSNDIILGFTNDVFQFTMLQEAMMLELRKVYPELELGRYYHNAGSMHIYDRHFEMAAKILEDERSLELPMIPMDAFTDDILTGLVGCEAAYQDRGTEEGFTFESVGAFSLLTPYWQHLMKMCYLDDHDSLHAIFGIPEGDHNHG